MIDGETERDRDRSREKTRRGWMRGDVKRLEAGMSVTTARDVSSTNI